VLFISYICKQDDDAFETLKADTKIGEALQGYIAHHQKDEKTMQLLSESVAYLPIEDLVLHGGSGGST